MMLCRHHNKLMVITSSYCLGFILSIAVFFKVGVLVGNYIALLTTSPSIVVEIMKGIGSISSSSSVEQQQYCMDGDSSCIAAIPSFTTTTTTTTDTTTTTATTTITNLFEGANHRETATAYYNKVLGLLTTTTATTSTATTTIAKEEEEEQKDNVLNNNNNNNQCGLYLAPSTLPHAGLGLFSGYDIPQKHSVNEYIGFYNDKEEEEEEEDARWTDLFIPIADEYKALPFRGQERFPSWLQYIWPKYIGAMSDLDESNDLAFPNVPHVLWDFDTGLNYADGVEFYVDDVHGQQKERTNAFVPGIASLSNSHKGLHNIDRIYENSHIDYNGQMAPWQPGAGAYTPHHGIEFYTTKKIHVGMELLLDYGHKWNVKNNEKFDYIAAAAAGTKKKKKKKDGMSFEKKKGFVEGINNKWNLLDGYAKDNCPNELPTEKAKRDRLEKGMAADSSMFKKGEKPYSEYRMNDYHPRDVVEVDDIDNANNNDDLGDDYGPRQIRKPLTWLNRNGVCLSSGKLQVKKSTIPFAGRGLFATTHISKDEVVITSPLLAMREEDFAIYKTNMDEKLPWKIVDKTNVVATELIFNYAFSHPTSPLFLVPNAPLANFINHGGGGHLSANKNNKSANVQVRWPKSGSTAAKLFEWAYNQKQDNHFDNSFETMTFHDPNPWLHDHPIDVMERSGKLGLEYVALRDITHGEEILLDYGPLWDKNWDEYSGRNAFARAGYFRQHIGIPTDFFPDNWHNVNSQYEIAEIQDLINKPLTPGQAVPMTWAHNGKPVSSKYAYVVGMEKGFSNEFLKYSEEVGVIELYRKLLTEQEGYILPSDGFSVFKPSILVNDTIRGNEMEFFAHRYKSESYNFNMHFVAAWEESAREDMLRAVGDAGLDLVINGIGERFGYDNMTCFHSSYMGVTQAGGGMVHSDIYATGDKSWNIVFPLITVEGSDPELSIISEKMNTVVGVNYLKDVAYLMGDFGYHQTRPKKDTGMRVVFGVYCSQIDETNIAMIRHVYDGDDPAPFADQFISLPMKEAHWSKDSELCSLGKPCGLKSPAPFAEEKHRSNDSDLCSVNNFCGLESKL